MPSTPLFETHPALRHSSKAPTAVGIFCCRRPAALGIRVIDGTAATNGSPSGNAELRSTRKVSLLHLQLILREGGAELTLPITAWPIITGPATSCSPAGHRRVTTGDPAR